MIDRQTQKDAHSGAKTPQLRQLYRNLSPKLSTSKTQQSKLATKQRFTRKITLVLS